MPEAQVDGGAVELRGVTKRFGDVLAVDGVDLHIGGGELFSLLGPSGSGKTTVLRLIAGFETPTAGTIELGGHDVTHTPPYARDVNTVFQDYALFPHLSVLQNVEYGLKVKKVAKAERRRRAHEMLDIVRLGSFGARRPDQLSGGQRQRVALARALVNRPRVLLLDEPLGALDLKLRMQMQLELKALQRRSQTTFVYVTHDQGEALAMADRIAVMNAGRIEQVGTPEHIYTRPETRFVAHFIGDTNLFNARVVERDPGGELVLDAAGLTVRVVDSGQHAPGDEIDVSLRPEKIRIGAPQDPRPGHTATVASVIFLGPLTRYQVTAGGLSLIVQHQTESDEHFRAGDQVHLRWSPGAPVLLRG